MPEKLKEAGIAVDDWKLPIFEEVLETNGYTWTKHPGLTEDMILLKVKTPDLITLGEVVKVANLRAHHFKHGN